MYLGPEHYGYFFLTLALLMLSVRRFPRIAAITEGMVQSVTQRAFHSSSAELPKFAMLRIALGIMLAWRAIDILLLLTPADFHDPEVLFAALANILSAILLTLGFATQYTLAFLMLVQWQQSDWMLGTSTLGNDIAAMLSIMLIFANAGRYYSLDSLIIRRWSSMQSFLLYFSADPTPATLQNGKFLALLSYWLLCLYSLAMHLNEPAWMTGIAGPQLLASNFMSNIYVPIAALFENSELAVHLARISLWLMLPWYFLVLPATLLGGLLRTYVIVWGILFFLLSKFVLQLGWLAEIEFLFWAGLFWSRTGIAHPGRLGVAYDDTCNLCDRTVQAVRLLDIFDRVKLMPASQHKDWLANHGISYARAMEDLHGVDARTGRIHAGYDFYVALARHLVLLWPVYPLLILGRVTRVGPALYRWVAERRKRLFGVCRVPSRKRHDRRYEKANDMTQPSLVASLRLHIVLCGILFITAIPAPFIGHKGWKNPLGEMAHIYGIAPINVFNKTDLRMAENWFTLEAIKEGRATLIPAFRPDGSRLRYHRSDRIYFGGTLPWRRISIPYDDCGFNRYGGIIRYLASVYLTEQRRPSGEYAFRFTQYHEPVADAELLMKNRYVRGQRSVRCTQNFTLKHPSQSSEIIVPLWKKG